MFEVSNGTYDDACRASFMGNVSTSVSWWLSASYAYYCRFESLLSDTVFDRMSEWMLANYHELKHPHKFLVTEEMLKAGSAYNLKEEDYPLIVRQGTDQLIRDLEQWRAART